MGTCFQRVSGPSLKGSEAIFSRGETISCITDAFVKRRLGMGFSCQWIKGS